MFDFDNSYVRELEGLYARGLPERRAAPRLLKLNPALAIELGLSAEDMDTARAVQVFAGSATPHGAQPIAQAYAGHQFGNFVPQLGDGRALLLGEVIDRAGNRRDIQLKGSGRTAFSRSGDGQAAVGPMLREYLMGEAMHHLGIATTRALAVVATGEEVYRDTRLPGAVLTRVAASHIRIGTFEYVAARGDLDTLQRLTDYTVRRHYPEQAGRPYTELLEAYAQRLAALIADWMGAGFIHGVMNTDNLALSGETLDYGPCAFMEHYDPATVFSSIDRQGRYAYGNQPTIAQWNLARFAETLLPLLHDDQQHAIELATAAVGAFAAHYEQSWLRVMRRKLGLQHTEADDALLAQDYLDAMQAAAADYTLACRALADATEGREERLRALFTADTAKLDDWLPRWRARLAQELRPVAEIATDLRAANPYLIPRNYLVEQALQAASEHGEMKPFDDLVAALCSPHEERDALRAYAAPAPRAHTARFKTFCGT